MRLAAFAVGILGGIAGLARHAILIVIFFSHGHGLFQVFLQLVLAAVLGLAAIIIAVLWRDSLKTLGVCLPLLGVLGLFPAAWTWMPAATLLVIGGLIALVALWQESRAKAGAGLFGAESWSSTRTTAVVAAGVVAVLVVVPVSLWWPGGSAVAASGQPLRLAAAPATTSTSSTTATTSGDSSALQGYRDSKGRFDIQYPAGWKKTELKLLGDGQVGPDSIVGFADQNGPKANGYYLDFIKISVLAEEIAGEPEAYLRTVKDTFDEGLDSFRQEYGKVEIVTPPTEADVESVPGLKSVISFSVEGDKLLVMDAFLVSGSTAYVVALSATEKDWTRLKPVFEKIVEGFQPGEMITSDGSSSTTTTAHKGSGPLETYSDGLWGFSITYPKGWTNTDPSEVGVRQWWDEGRVQDEEYANTYVAAAFADWKGPSLDGCYLDFAWIEVHDNVETNSSTTRQLVAGLNSSIEYLKEYTDVEVIETAHETVVGGLPAASATCSIFYNGYTLVIVDTFVVLSDSVYYLEFGAVEDDWGECEPLFKQMLEDFKATGSSNLV